MENKKLTKTQKTIGLLALIAGLGVWAFRPTRKILSNLKIRVDSLGNGNYNASRSGSLGAHKGIDLVVSPGEKVYAPFSGTVIYLENAYTVKGKTFQGIKIFTDDGKLEVDILYIVPKIFTNETVKKGQLIGHAQDISSAYTSAMLPHIHIEHKDRASGQFIDPTNYYFPNNPARTASIGEPENPSFT